MLTTILPFTSCHRQTYMAIHFAARARAIRAHVALSLQVPDDGLGSAAAAALKEEVDRARAEVETLCVKLTQRDDEIRLLEQTNAARETAHFSEAGRSLRQLEDAKRREEAALQAQLGELRQQRSNERIEAEQATKRLWLELSLRDAEANTRALELCSQLEQMEALQDTLESQFATLQRSGRDVSELRAQRDAVLQANTRALADSSARVDELDAQARRVAEELVGASAHVSSLQAEVERQAAELEAARTAGEGAATTASKASAKARESADKAVDKAAKTAAGEAFLCYRGRGGRSALTNLEVTQFYN
ncbi:hypothetical protein T492DRAFT_261754 [Pavlovales sp. CCMP2436]|nr:hypothetical protein T492DRAFT_261754 [Pavlovales sp. CCMP2436]